MNRLRLVFTATVLSACATLQAELPQGSSAIGVNAPLEFNQKPIWEQTLNLFLNEVMGGEFSSAHKRLSSRWSSFISVEQFQTDFQSMSLPQEKCLYLQQVLTGPTQFTGDERELILELGEDHRVKMRFENLQWRIDSIE